MLQQSRIDKGVFAYQNRNARRYERYFHIRAGPPAVGAQHLKCAIRTSANMVFKRRRLVRPYDLEDGQAPWVPRREVAPLEPHCARPQTLARCLGFAPVDSRNVINTRPLGARFFPKHHPRHARASGRRAHLFVSQ